MRTLANQCLPLILVMMKGPLCFVAVMQTRARMHAHWLNRMLTAADNAVGYLIKWPNVRRCIPAGMWSCPHSHVNVHKSRSMRVWLCWRTYKCKFLSATDEHVLLCSSPAPSASVSKNKDPITSHKLFMCIDFPYETCCAHFQFCSAWNWSKPTFKLQWKSQNWSWRKQELREVIFRTHI